jgi:hypothetical protein
MSHLKVGMGYSNHFQGFMFFASVFSELPAGIGVLTKLPFRRKASERTVQAGSPM